MMTVPASLSLSKLLWLGSQTLTAACETSVHVVLEQWTLERCPEKCKVARSMMISRALAKYQSYNLEDHVHCANVTCHAILSSKECPCDVRVSSSFMDKHRTLHLLAPWGPVTLVKANTSNEPM